MRALRVFDGFLADPESYRRAALNGEFKSYHFEGGITFHGISIPADGEVTVRITERYPKLTPTLSFFRRSPAGQSEPHYIHTDIDMGDWTALLYLNPDPPPGDGTAFWQHRPTGAIESAIAHERSEEGRRPNPEIWKPWRRVSARFNRMIMFPATYFHSRAIFDNWGSGDGARLTQVVFGRGELK